MARFARAGGSRPIPRGRPAHMRAGCTHCARWRIATDPRRTADQYAVWLHQLLALEGYGKADVSAVIIGTVVPRALHNLEVLASKYFGVTPLVAGEAPVDWGIALDVAEPKS